MVVIAQLAEHRIVVPSVVGSSPTLHPIDILMDVYFCVVACTCGTYYLFVQAYQ